MLQKIVASHRLPPKSLKRHVNTYWTSYNPTNEYIDVPIVPNGCIYIIWKNGKAKNYTRIYFIYVHRLYGVCTK